MQHFPILSSLPRHAISIVAMLLLSACGGEEGRVKTAAENCVKMRYERQADKFDDFKFEVKPGKLDDAQRKNKITWSGVVHVSFTYTPKDSSNWVQRRELVQMFIRDDKLLFYPSHSGGNPCLPPY